VCVCANIRIRAPNPKSDFETQTTKHDRQAT
jgi:hypothetical protein